MKRSVYAQIAVTVKLHDVEGATEQEIVENAEHMIFEWSDQEFRDHIEVWELEDFTEIVEEGA